MLRPELTPRPPRIARLPVDDRGYPVPKFVEWIDGKPDFRVMSRDHWIACVQRKLCWVCGDPLGQYMTFVVGPMCGLNLTTAEPPCHQECAEWSAVNCPFLSRPHMHRREDDFTKGLEEHGAGIQLKRNPGVGLLWTTKVYRVFNDGRGRPLIQMGPSTSVAWVAEGRNATRDEVEASVLSGLPALQDMAEQETTELARMDARKELARRLVALQATYPPSQEAIEA